MSLNNKFAYTDELDKCYGITGMILSLNVFDNESMLKSVNLDNGQGDYLEFTPDFCFCGNPRFSAKVAWNEMLKQYQLYTALVVGNIMCRYTVEMHKAINHDLLLDILDIVEEDGRDICQLEDDEINMVLDKTYNYLYRLYTNRQVHSIVNALVNAIKQRRSMTGAEVLDTIQYLRRNS